MARAVPQPCIVARASDGNVKDAFLVIECLPLSKTLPEIKSCLLVLFIVQMVVVIAGSTFLGQVGSSTKAKCAVVSQLKASL